MSKQSQIKYERLMKKAEELFLKYGYKAVSMDQIARETGISKMTIYKKYPSKDDLFVGVLVNMTDYHTGQVALEMNRFEHTVDKIECLYSYSLNNISLIPEQLIKEIVERAYVMQELTAYKQKWIMGMWRTLLEDGIQKGEIRPLDVEFTATLLINMPMAFVQTDYYTNPEKLNVLLTNFYDFVKYGLLGGDPSCCKKKS